MGHMFEELGLATLRSLIKQRFHAECAVKGFLFSALAASVSAVSVRRNFRWART